MKKGLFIFLLFISASLFSQIYIKGKVTTSANEILEGASVYLNNTTIGTTTNDKGEFLLKVQKGNYNLVVSFIGYTTSQVKINTDKKIDFLLFKLKPESNILDEVVLRKTVYDDEWRYNLSRFKQAFLGKANLAKECIILNPKVLHFEYNRKSNELTAFAKEPLRIKHKGLGYLIEYDLINFSIQGRYTFYSGYTKYQNLKKRIKKKWKRNRLEAYNGSLMHFLRSLLHKNLAKEGFLINQFRRELNPERPSDTQIKKARELIRLSREAINFSKKISKPITALDSALVISRKSSLPKYQDYLYKKNIPNNEMISFFQNTPYLDFVNHLSIIYKNEKEEDNYLAGMFGQRKKASDVQTSSISLTQGKSIIDITGILTDPNAIITEGYWSYESFANALPLDYQPLKN